MSTCSCNGGQIDAALTIDLTCVQCFLIREVVFTCVYVFCNRRLVTGFVGHEIQTSRNYIKLIYFSSRCFDTFIADV